MMGSAMDSDQYDVLDLNAVLSCKSLVCGDRLNGSLLKNVTLIAFQILYRL